MSTTYINVKSKIFAQNFNFKLEIELHLWFSMQLGQYIHYCHCPRVGRPEHLHLHPYHSDIIASRSHCREWALLSFHSVCLSVCRSFRDLQPTTIDWSQPMNQIWLAGIYLYSDPCKPFPILWVPEGKICKISPISNAYSCHCERDASCHMTCSTNTYINKEIIDSRLCPGAAFWWTQLNTVVVWRPTGTATWQTLLNIMLCLILAHWPHGMKTWCHPQNRK